MDEILLMQNFCLISGLSADEAEQWEPLVLACWEELKGKLRAGVDVKIKETEVEIADRLDKIPDTLKADGYPDVQVFMRTFREMESVVEQYNRDLAEWEYQVSRKPTAATKEQHRPPERQSVLKHLREIQERNKQQPPQRQYKKSIDRDSR